MRTRRTLVSIVTSAIACNSLSAIAAEARFENEYARWVIGSDGRTLQFADKRTNANYSVNKPGTAVAWVKEGGKEFAASSVTQDGDRTTIAFDKSKVAATLRITTKPHYFIAEVVSVSDEKIDELTFVDVPLTLKASPDEPFGACALALNLKTNVAELPGFNSRLRAMCYPRFGMVGAKVALIGCPSNTLRDVIKEAVSEAPDLPHSPLGGPWALDAPIAQGSYLFNFGNLSEKTVDEWIRVARETGMNQIDFHGGGSFRFGDIRPNPETYPNGRASLKAVIDRLHAAGIKAGLHTYAFFLDKHCEWVSPKPDPRLGKDATFTLAAPLPADAAAVPVVESTAKMSTITGFFVWNSVTLQVDDELITYGGVGKEPPYSFTQCKRGAWGTKPAAHAQGAKMYHLKECFGLFVPDGDSTLFEEVAARTAETFNECGFDMMYLDALDGEGILGGPEAGWHYGSKFVFEICKRLKRPALMEMSTFHHHLWYVRSRYCAWDHPNRAHKKFIDVHVAANNDNRRIFMPGHLGWWAVKTWGGTQTEPTFADDIEYLCCKCIGTDTGFSLIGIDPQTLKQVPAFARLAPITRQYEALRHAGKVPESIKAQLRAPGQEFTLVRKGDGGFAFRPVRYDRHKVEGINGWSDAWTTSNKFGRQPVQLRIEALCGAGPYDAPGNPTLADFSDAKDFPERSAAPGMTADLRTSSAQGQLGIPGERPGSSRPAGGRASPADSKAGSIVGEYTAAHAQMPAVSPAPPRGRPEPTWTKIGKTFAPPLDLSKHPGMGVWVYGDGQGEVLNFQLKNPPHVVGGLDEHYVVVDFTGWRYFELLEPEGNRCDDYTWPYSGNYYALYREIVQMGQVESIGVWYNNVPAGKTMTCYISPIKAIPVFDTKLTNPAVTIGDKTITFPVTMTTGSYLEYRSASDCKLYGPKGELIAEINPQGDAPALAPGDNRVEFRATAPENLSVRAYVTVISQGEPLHE
jgi:hypothetical protein